MLRNSTGGTSAVNRLVLDAGQGHLDEWVKILVELTHHMLEIV